MGSEPIEKTSRDDRGLPAILKAQTIGALLGFLAPIVMMIVNRCYKNASEGNSIDWFLAITWGLTLAPAIAICNLFGYKLQIDMTVGRESSWFRPVVIAALVNALL